jgi:hypothetical protein
VALGLPGSAEAEVRQADGAPDQEGRHAGQVDDVAVGLAGAGADVHHAEGTEQVGQQDGGDGHAALVGPAEELGRLFVLGHEQDGPAADVNGAVDGAEAGDEDEGIDEVDAALPAGVLDGNGHGAAQSTARAANEAFSVGRAGQTKEEGAAHVDDDDADEDLADGKRDGMARIARLGGGYSDGLDTGVEGTAEDKDGGDATEAICESAGLAPIPETERVSALDTARCITGKW